MVGWSKTSTARGTGSMREHGGGLDDRELVDEVGHVGRGHVAHDLADAGEAVLEAELDALQQLLGRGHGDGDGGGAAATRRSQRARRSATNSANGGWSRSGARVGLSRNST